MRIVAGEFKGRRLEFRSTPDVRPATEKVRAALFDILQQRIIGMEVLDLYCGSGSIGIEALSRGAARADFVDIRPGLASRNIRRLGIVERCRVYRRDALKALTAMQQEKVCYDLVYVGAPYDLPDVPRVIQTIDASTLLRDGGLLVHEHRKNAPQTQGLVHLQPSKSYLYGQTGLRFYERAP